MTIEDDMACLKQFPLFRALPKARLKLVALMGEKLQFKGGDRIIEEGERAEGVYFILGGEVELSHERDDGKTKRLVLATGMIFGDVPMLCDQPYVGEVTAKSDVAALRLPRDLFFELLETIPDFSIALSRDLASRLYKLADAVLHTEKVH
jgi:CRP-like cAMP-binding protein